MDGTTVTMTQTLAGQIFATAAASDIAAAPPGASGDPATNRTADYSEKYSCDPADGSADAIVILEWQQWAQKMRAAQSP